MIDGGEGVFPGAPGSKLYYQWWRPESCESRAAVAAVHGPGSFSQLIDLFVDELVPRGYCLYVFAHRQLGRLPGQRGYVQEWGERLEDVHAFVQLIGEQVPRLPVFLLGNHVGGQMALSHALRHPDGLAGVVALGPAVPAPAPASRPVRLERRLARIWPVGVDLDQPDLNGDDEVQSAVAPVIPAAHPENEAQAGPVSDLPVASRLADLAIPHVVIGSEAHGVDGYPDGLVQHIAAWLEAHIQGLAIR